MGNSRSNILYKMYIDSLNDLQIDTSWKTQYLRFRMGRLKHRYWLANRKHPTTVILDSYDHFILERLQPGPTAIFGSAGYYLEDVVPDLHIVEMHSVVKTFYPAAIIVSDRAEIKHHVPKCANFIVNNNRLDHWMPTVEALNHNIQCYVDCLQPGGLLFYSFRDTQMLPINRLTTDMEMYWQEWSAGLPGLQVVWSDINFEKQESYKGVYPCRENPDTTNGNLKFIFQVNTYKNFDG